VVRGPQGVQVDPTGKMPGRGAYLHDQRSCWEKGLKGALSRALKADLTDEERGILLEFAGSLSQTDTVPGELPVQERPDV
jgi:uncharacterized protein